MTPSPGAVLFVSPFKSTRGYAWDFIGSLYARIADHLAQHKIPAYVAYPSMPAPPAALQGSAARPVQLDASLSNRESSRATRAFIRRENVGVVHFISHPAWSLQYLSLRRAGVRRIIVYDHTSGEFTRPRGLWRFAKWVVARAPGINADIVLAVSEYVAHRQIDVGMQPRHRVATLWNGIPTVQNSGAGGKVREIFAVPKDRPLVLCNCRATPEKGVHHLLRAFDQVMQGWPANAPRPFLVYLGDGPYLEELSRLHNSLTSREAILLGGYRSDAKDIMQGANLCVIPSVWQDAFPLAVLEAMACGKPLVATRVGGIPEMVEDGVTGLLVPPGDETALAQAISHLLQDPTKSTRFGDSARQRVAERFSPEQQVARLTALIEEGLGKRCEALRNV